MGPWLKERLEGGKATNPIVQVLFEDNKNNEWNQTEWIKNTLLYLQKNYQVNKANIVGLYGWC